MKIPEITMDMFFKVGRACFLVIAVASSFNLLLTYELLNFPSILSSLASIVFNFVAAGFFHYMVKQGGSSSTLPDFSNKELEELKDNFGK